MKKRSSNFELLRIFAMFMIIIYHMYFHCIQPQLKVIIDNGGAFSAPFFYKKLLILVTMTPWGMVGNSIFILISGYFNIQRNRINLTNILKKLFGQLLFATVFLCIISLVLVFVVKKASLQLISIDYINTSSWFVGYYFSIIIIGALVLNSFISNISQEKYLTFLSILFGITQFSWIYDSLNNTVCNLLIWGIFLYSLGGYIKLYNPLGKIKLFIFFFIILISFLIIYISNYTITLENITLFNIGFKSGYFNQTFISFSDNSFICFLISISVFEIFRRIHIKNNSLINFIGSSTLMVYLIHDNNLFYTLWGFNDWINVLDLYPLVFILQCISYAIGTFLIGLICYEIYLLIQNLLNKINFMLIDN